MTWKIIGTVLLVLTLRCTALAQRTPGLADCTLARDQLTQLNDRILLGRGVSSQLTPELMKAGTGSLESYVTKLILARLSDSDDPSVIISYLKCMQERDGEKPEDLTNTPVVFLNRKDGTTPLALTAMLIMRGGSAIPNTRALIQCFAKKDGNWATVPSARDEEAYDGHTLFIYPLRSPVQDEDWYLLSGRVIGSSGGSLRLEVISCSNSHLKLVWTRENIFHGEVEVQGDVVILRYNKQGDARVPPPAGKLHGPEFIIMDGDPADPSPVQFSEKLRVTAKGLEP
jgi:hypothetical protein